MTLYNQKLYVMFCDLNTRKYFTKVGTFHLKIIEKLLSKYPQTLAML